MGPAPAPPSPLPLRFGLVGCVGWFRKSFKLLGFPNQATFEKLPKKVAIMANLRFIEVAFGLHFLFI